VTLSRELRGTRARTPVRRLDPGLAAEVVKRLQDEPKTTARITGLRTADEPGDVSQLRAKAVRNAITVALDEDGYVVGTDGIEVSYDDDKGDGSDLGARRAWVSPVDEVGALRGVRIDLQAPA
jgi:hypothetical protein